MEWDSFFLLQRAKQSLKLKVTAHVNIIGLGKKRGWRTDRGRDGFKKHVQEWERR